MIALSQNFNKQNIDPHFDAAKNADYFNGMFQEVDLTQYDVDVVFNKLGDTGNEQAFAQVLELASVTGDKIGKMEGLAQGVDQSLEAREGNRTKNLSGEQRVEHKEELLTRLDQGQIETLDYAPPPVRSEDDLEMALSDLCLMMEEAGVSDCEIKKALAAGGPDNPYETVLAFKELADEYKIPEAQGYLNIVENDMIEAKLLPEPVLAVAAPAFAANDPRFDMNQSQPSAMRMG